MRHLKSIVFLLFIIALSSCGKKEKKLPEAIRRLTRQEIPSLIPVDKGFSKYISGYTSGVISSASPIEIRFTPEFASLADKSAGGLFTFDPYLKGRSEWENETTLAFIPSDELEPGRIYTGTLDLGKLAGIDEKYRSFPVRIQVMSKDFRVITGYLECDPDNEGAYLLHGELALSDIISDKEI